MSKLNSINTDMDELHDLNNELYEALVDEEFGNVKIICNRVIKKLRDIISVTKQSLI